MPDPTDVLYEKRSGVARLTINRPASLNALRTQTYEELITCMRDATLDDGVGVIVMTGAGDRAFSAGGDVKEQQTRTTASGRQHVNRLMELARLIRGGGKPVIAAVNGYAVGAGNEIHLMCDLTIASDRAVFAEAGTRVGTAPVWGSTQLLPRLLGDKRAREMIYLCRRFTAAEAYDLGLVNKVVEHADLDREVSQWCEDLLDKSPQALRIAKTSINYESDQLYSSFVHGLEMMSLVYGNPEFLEGVNAFLEKRPTDYRRFRGAHEGE